MDIYDHIEEQTLSPSAEKSNPASSADTAAASASTTAPAGDQQQQQPANLQTELSSAFQTLQSSQWGSTLNSWFSTARKQGTSLYADLHKEASDAQQQATKGFSSLREQVAQRTRALSLNAEPGPESVIPGEESLPLAKTTSGAEASAAAEAEALQTSGKEVGGENLSADIVKEAGTLVASLRSTAASRLKDLQRAEDAADEALLKFGTNVRNFLRDAVTISAPDDGKEDKQVLFETSEPGTGKKIFHSTRLDAQLHAIHTTATSFTEDPAQGEEWEKWMKEFDIDSKTEDVAKDLDRYEELRRAMEKLVPEKVEYKTFWLRYYFLRKAVEEEEKRRREVLKATTETEEVAWDASDDEDDTKSGAQDSSKAINGNKAASASTTTLTQPATASNLKPNSPRRSHEDAKSVADSDASYDIVSGATSRAQGSPREEKRDVGGKDESDDDDWE